MRPREPGRLRHPAADDGVGAHRAGLAPLQVHGPAAAVGPAAVEPADLGERAPQDVAHLVGGFVERVDPLGLDVVQRLGEELVVAAVRPVDGVVAGERQHRADGAALLPDARVRRAVDQPGTGELEDVLLERADPAPAGVWIVRSRAGSAASQSAASTTTSTQGEAGANRWCSGMTAPSFAAPPWHRFGSQIQIWRASGHAQIAMCDVVWDPIAGGVPMPLPGLRRVDHIGFTVPDLDQAHGFLVDVLGFEYLYSLGPFRHDDDWMATHLAVASARGDEQPLLPLRRRDDARGVRVRRARPARRPAAQQRHRRPPRRAVRRRPGRRHRAPAGGGPRGVRRADREPGPAEGQRWIYFLSPWGMQFELVSYPGGKAFDRDDPRP